MSSMIEVFETRLDITFTLKGSRAAVFRAIAMCLERNIDPCIFDLADITWYSEATVKNAIKDLIAHRLIKAERPGRGHKYKYTILVNDGNNHAHA